MTIDIGRVFSNTFNMVKERWLSMIGLWAAFFGFMILYGIVMAAVMGASMLALGSVFTDPSALSNPAAIGSVGVGAILMVAVLYIGYFAIAFGQQGSMAAMASPLHRINFGEAFQRGLKGGVSFLGVLVLFVIAYIAFALIFVALAAVLGEASIFIIALLLIPIIPAFIYLALRFSVIMPVIVVDNVYNPIKAIARSWQITSGNVLGILVVYIAFAVVAFVVVALPAAMLGATIDPASASAGAAIGVGIFFIFFFIAVAVAFTLFSASLVASLHAEMSDTQAVELGKTFE